jgi:hypothetical protein
MAPGKGRPVPLEADPPRQSCVGRSNTTVVSGNARRDQLLLLNCRGDSGPAAEFLLEPEQFARLTRDAALAFVTLADGQFRRGQYTARSLSRGKWPSARH